MKVLKFWILRPKPHIVCDFRWPLTRPQNLGESKSKGLRWGGRYHTFSLVNLGSFELWLKVLILFVPFDSSEWEVLTIIYHHQKVKDVRLPVQLQRAMAAEAEAAREARAKVNIIAVVMVTLCIIMVTIGIEEKHTKQNSRWSLPRESTKPHERSGTLQRSLLRVRVHCRWQFLFYISDVDAKWGVWLFWWYRWWWRVCFRQIYKKKISRRPFKRP